MRELTIHHIAAESDTPARVRVGFRAHERAQPHERETEFRFSVSPEDRRLIRWYLEEYLLYPWGEFRTRAQTAEQVIERLGTELFESVFSDRETLALYSHVADHLNETRIVIHAADPVGIALPWEFMRDATHGDYGDLARLTHAFVRSQPDLSFVPPTVETNGTFNILMVICRPGGPEGDVPFQSVARPLLELFRPHRDRINLNVLRPPTLEQLGCELAENPGFYHVVHFDGHGVFPGAVDPTQFYAQPGVQGRLVFEDAEGQPHPVTGQELGGLLAGKGVPIVLLNACQSGMTHPESLYPSLGNQLLKAGTAGVVAMAYSVYVHTAVRFMARLYEGLIAGDELARAVAQSREGLRNTPQRPSPIGEIPLRDWVVPVLFEAAAVRPVEKPMGELHLNAGVLEAKQAKAGAEIECPAPPAFGFVGRDGLMLKLDRAFRQETVVLLQGMAGVGKTESAVGFARWLAETGGLDGPIFFFSLEHYTPLAQVCDRICQVFAQAIKEQLGAEWHLLEAEKRRAIAMDLLKQVPCLLIWDNFEPVFGFPSGTASDWTEVEQQDLRKFLVGLRGGKTKVLLTSRRDEPWLGGVYRRVELGGLKLLEAQELAVRVLTRAGLKTNDLRELPSYNELLKYLRGNPLAIQVILPELRSRTPDELLEALKTGEAKLAGDDPAQGRERSLAASLTYRLDALDPMLRRRLAVLGLFQGFVDAHVLATMGNVEEAPELIRAIPPRDWITILDAAAEVGLLRAVGEGYYIMHPALPWFYHGLLHDVFAGQEDRLEQSYRTAYAAYGPELTRLCETDTQKAMSLLSAEENNLVNALSLAQRYEQWIEMERILFALRPLYTTQARWVEWERLLGNIEADNTDSDGEPLPGRESLWIPLLGHLQEIAGYRRDFDSQESNLLRLKEQFEQDGDEYNQAVTLHQLGRNDEERGEFGKAERWYQQSLAIAEKINDAQGQAQTLHQLGRVAEQQSQLGRAQHRYRRSLAIYESIGNEGGQALVLAQLASICARKRQHGEAEFQCKQSLAIQRRIGNVRDEAQCLHLLGIIAQERRQLDEAERWYRQSLAIRERIGDEKGQVSTLHQLGTVAHDRQQLDEADRWYRRSLAIAERIGDEHGQAGTLHQLGRTAEEQSRTSEAVEFYEKAEAICLRQDDPHTSSIVRESLARVRGK